jgi:hypothetical protein
MDEHMDEWGSDGLVDGVRIEINPLKLDKWETLVLAMDECLRKL